MYDGRSTSRASREPACCTDRRFAIPGTVRRRYDSDRSLAPKGSVVTGSYLEEAEDFPRHHPPSIASSLTEAAGEGFAVMSGSAHGVATMKGNSFTRQGISLP